MENIIDPVITKKIKGFIYKLYNKNDETMFYIGSSTTSLYIRTHEHKQRSKRGTNKLYTYIRDNEGIENFIGEVIEFIEVDNTKELRQKEQEFIDLLNPSLNSNVATTNINIDFKNNPKEYLKEYRKTKNYNNYMKSYYQNHKLYMKKYYKDYYQKHKKVKLN